MIIFMAPMRAHSGFFSSYNIIFEDRVDNSILEKDNDFNDFVINLQAFDMGTVNHGVVSIKPVMAAGMDETHLWIQNFCDDGNMEYSIHNARLGGSETLSEQPTECVSNNNNGQDFSIVHGELTQGQKVRVSKVSDLFPGCPKTSMINLTSQTTNLCEGRTVIIAWKCLTHDAPKHLSLYADYSELFVLENRTEGIDISSSTNVAGGLPGVALFNEDIYLPTERTSIFDAFSISTTIQASNEDGNSANCFDDGELDFLDQHGSVDEILAANCAASIRNAMSVGGDQAKRRDYIMDPDWHESIGFWNSYITSKELGTTLSNLYTDHWHLNDDDGLFYYEEGFTNERLNNFNGINISSDQYRFSDFHKVYDETQPNSYFYSSYPDSLLTGYSNVSQSTPRHCSHFDNGFTFDNTPTPQ